ncbi:MAG: hypothetical protein KKF78_02810 [Candidatus Omnitrophica bacterium]|nr:hypothetical protein [Candidatus Omnitrophota bacterium]
MITYIISKVLKLSDKALKTLYKFSIPIIILNIICILIVAGIYRRQLAPLRIMFASISAGIKSGLINEDHKVYIDNNLPDYMPALCWNIEMGERYVKEGNYKWLFSKNELINFTENPDNSYWIIDKESFTVIIKTEDNLNKSVNKIYEDKEDQYRELALYYIEQEDLAKAEKYVNILQEINPYNMGNKMAKRALELKMFSLNN